MDIKSLISQGSILLKNNNIPTFKIDSEILMTKVTQKDKKYIILNAKFNISLSINVFIINILTN